MSALDHLIGGGRSLKRRLLINITLALLLCVALAGTILISEFYEHLEENVKDALTLEAEEVVGQIDPNATGLGLNPQALRFQGVEGTYRYTVFDGEGRAIAGGEASADIWAQLSNAALGQPMDITLPGDRIGVGLHARIKGHDVFVLASAFPRGTEQTRFQKLLHEIEEEIWWVVLGIAVIVGAALLATRSALASLDIVSHQAQEVGPFDSNRRLSADKVPTEIRPLIRAVNGAFDRLDQGYQAQRDFSSNVAHEIRTPLAVLRSSVDRISDAELRSSLAEDLSSLDRMFEQLIDLSRADALRDHKFESIDLRALVLTQVGDLAIEALQKGRTLGVTGANKTEVMGHAGLLGIALQNLVHNALRYAPEGSEVEIEVMQSPPGIRVMDEGPGVPDALKRGLFERFNRGKASDQFKGSGIGLAIVQSVAHAHGATSSVTDRPGGGSIFAIVWPDTVKK